MEIVEKILKNPEKPLDEVAELLGMTPSDIVKILIQRDRAPLVSDVPVAEAAPEKPKKPKDSRTDKQLAEYFLNRLEKESLSVSALNNKYKVKDKERVERILEKLLKEGKLAKRESRNKKGRFVYYVPEK